MYIWTGCRLPQAFESQIRSRCLALNETFALDVSGFTLPQHISLKISFDAGDRYTEILDAIEALLRQEAPFAVIPSGIEQHGGILWVTFRENETLRALHALLDSKLESQFAIPQHPFDKKFFFHSALFAGDPKKISQAHTVLQDYLLPSELKIDTFLLGVSEIGKSGSYRVVREIKV